MTETLPALPYAGTAGYSGSETSEAAARTEAADGTVEDRQRVAVRLLRATAAHGMTVAEFRATTGLHHGKASSTMTTLHKEGHVCRLLERRSNYAVYVLPEFVGDRETAAQGRRDPVDEALQEWLARDEHGWSRAGRDPKAFVKAMRAVSGYGT